MRPEGGRGRARRRVVHHRLRHGLDRTRPMDRLASAELSASVSRPGPDAGIAAHRGDLQCWSGRPPRAGRPPHRPRPHHGSPGPPAAHRTPAAARADGTTAGRRAPAPTCSRPDFPTDPGRAAGGGSGSAGEERGCRGPR
ncbi:hypothetical protein KPATCC21470_8630 [Kitasatospora purpeofusca]